MEDLFTCTGDQKILLALEQGFSDGLDLLFRFPPAEDYLGKALSKSPMMIYLCKLKILVWKILQETKKFIF